MAGHKLLRYTSDPSNLINKTSMVTILKIWSQKLANMHKSKRIFFKLKKLIEILSIEIKLKNYTNRML